MKISRDEAVKIIQEEAPKFGVPVELAVRILDAENNGKKEVSSATISPRGAMGIMQVMPNTLTGLKRLGLLPQETVLGKDPRQDIQAGLAAIVDLQKQHGKDAPWQLIAAGYNASPKAIQTFKRTGDISSLPNETQRYVRNWFMDANSDPRRFPPAGSPVATATTPSPAIAPPSFGTSPAGFGDMLQQSIDAITGFRGASANATNQGVAAQQAAGAAAVAEAGLKTEAIISQNAQREQILAAMGLAPDAVTSAGAAATQALAAATPQLENIRTRVAANAGVNPLFNPVGWILAQTENEQLTAEYNALAGNVNQKWQNLAAKQATVRAQQQIDIPVTAENLRMQTAAAQTRLRELTNAQTAQAVGQEISQQAAWQSQIFAMRLQAAGLDMRQIAAANREQAAKEKSDEFRFARVNAARAAYGFAPFASKIEYDSLPKDQKEMWEFVSSSDMFSDGDFGQALTRARQLLGSSQEIRQQFGTGRANPAAVTAIQMANLLDDNLFLTQKVAPEVSKMYASLGSMGKQRQPKVEDLKATAPQVLKNELDAAMRDRTYAVTNSAGENVSPFRFRAAFAPENNQVTQLLKQFGPGSKTPLFTDMRELNEAKVLEIVTTQVASGTMRAEDAAKAVAEYFRGMNEQAYIRQQLGKLTIIAPQSWNASLPVQNTGIFGLSTGRSAPIDLMNPAQVNLHLVREAAKVRLGAASSFEGAAKIPGQLPPGLSIPAMLGATAASKLGVPLPQEQPK